MKNNSRPAPGRAGQRKESAPAGHVPLDPERELLSITEACGTFPLSLVPRLEAQTGATGTLERALGAGLVSVSDVPTLNGGTYWYCTITRQGRQRLRADGQSRDWAPLDGWHRRTAPTDPPKSLTMHILRAQAFASTLLLVRAAGAEPQGIDGPRTPPPLGTAAFYSAGLCRRLLRESRPELRRVGRCQAGVLLRDGAAWVLNLVLRDGIPWNGKEEETAAAAFVGLVRCLGGPVETVNLLYIGQHMNEALLIKPPGQRRSRQLPSWYGTFQRTCFVESSPKGAEILRELLDPAGRQAARRRWIPEAAPPDCAHAAFDGITQDGRAVLLGHTCDLPLLHAMAQRPKPPLPVVLCYPEQEKVLAQMVRYGAEVLGVLEL